MNPKKRLASTMEGGSKTKKTPRLSAKMKEKEGGRRERKKNEG